MTRYYCLNDLFAYCKGTPEPNEGNEKITIVSLDKGCKKDIATCGKYCKASEMKVENVKTKQTT